MGYGSILTLRTDMISGFFSPAGIAMARREDQKFIIPVEQIIENLTRGNQKLRQNYLDLLNVMTWYGWEPRAFVAAGGIPALIRCLDDNNDESRGLSAKLIGYIVETCGGETTGAADAVPSLMKLFDGSSVTLSGKLLARSQKTLRVAAGNTLVKIGTPAVEPLTLALKHPGWDIRFNAARALGEIKDPRAVEFLCEILTDPARMVRNSAAWALGEIGEERAKASLQKAFKHALRAGDLSTQFAINAALEHIDEKRYQKNRE
jgi:HEAT repeats